MSIHHAIRRGVLATLLVAALLPGCSTTKVVGGWDDPAYTERPVRKVLVVGVTKSDSVQRMFESTMSWTLSERGAEGVPGTSVLPGGEKLSEEAIVAAIEGQGFDAVMVTRKVGSKERERWVPGTTYAVGSPYYGYGRMYPYYSGSYTVVHEPGHLEKEQVIQVESNLYSAKTRQLVWTARSDTVAPDTLDQAIDDIAKAMAKDLKDRGFLP